jgi:hypothetical protein
MSSAFWLEAKALACLVLISAHDPQRKLDLQEFKTIFGQHQSR